MLRKKFYLKLRFFILIFILILIFCVFFFLGPHLQHVEVPRLGVKLELQLPATVTAITM